MVPSSSQLWHWKKNAIKTRTKTAKMTWRAALAKNHLFHPKVRVRLQRLKIRAYSALYKTPEAAKEFALLDEIDSENAATLCLKSRIEFLNGNYAESLKQLKAQPQDTGSFKELGESDVLMHHNNTGCDYHSMGKYHLACLHFQKALNKNNELLSEFPKPSSGIIN